MSPVNTLMKMNPPIFWNLRLFFQLNMELQSTNLKWKSEMKSLSVPAEKDLRFDHCVYFYFVKALCIYEETIESNRHVFILLEDEEMLDTFSMKIGNIPPNERVYVTISYLQKLNSICNHIEPHGHNEIVAIFSMPFLLNSRYAPKSKLIFV